MNVTPIDDQTCFAFEKVAGDTDRGTLQRFVVGEDPGPRPMTTEQMEAELGDPFATLLLREGRFPRTRPGHHILEPPRVLTVGAGAKPSLSLREQSAPSTLARFPDLDAGRL